MSRCPTGKVRHANRGAAHTHRSKMKNSLLDVYHCAQCRGFHLGRTRDPARSAQRIGEVLDRYNRELAKRMKGRTE